MTAMLMSYMLCGDSTSMILHYIIIEGQHQQQGHFAAKNMSHLAAPCSCQDGPHSVLA